MRCFCTLGQVVLQDGLQISWRRLSNWFKFLVVCNLQTRAHIASIVSKINLQSLIAKYPLLIAKDRVCHFWVEGV